MLLDMSKQDDYDLACALRSADVGVAGSYPSGALKTITSAVVRYLVGVDGGHCEVTAPETAKVWWEKACSDAQRKAAIKAWKFNSHFEVHIRWAFHVLMAKNIAGAAEHYAWLKSVLDN